MRLWLWLRLAAQSPAQPLVLVLVRPAWALLLRDQMAAHLDRLLAAPSAAELG
jgi:hypothetical protein